MIRTLPALAAPIVALALAACVTAPATPAPSPAPAAEASSGIGRLYHYVRSNQDGALAEQIYVYRASATHVEVGKMVSPCTNAAFVTADLDLERNQPRSLVGGRIARDLSQEAFAWLEYDTAAREIHARIPAANLDVRAPVSHEPWLLYDFDLSDLNGLASGPPARADFSFGVALIWPGEDEANPFRDLGRANAHFAGAERHLDRDTLRFDVSGGLNGQLWLDAREGHVIEARFAEPNHTEYADFRFVLQSITDNGAEAWRAARAAHWSGCPAP